LIATPNELLEYRHKLLEHAFHTLLVGTYEETQGNELPVLVTVNVHDNDDDNQCKIIATSDQENDELVSFTVELYGGRIDNFYHLAADLELCLNAIIGVLPGDNNAKT
jgi:hypothetical protein